MTPFFKSFYLVFSQFPRAHLISTLVLTGIIGVAIVSPGFAPQAEHEQTTSLALPIPAKQDESAEATQAPARPWQTIEVKSGDTLSGLLKKAGVAANEIHLFATSHPKVKTLTQIKPKETFLIDVSRDGKLLALEYRPSEIERLIATRSDDGWLIEQEVREYQRQARYAEAVITDSLFLAGMSAGMSDAMTMKLANIFGWDIDFALDIRQGDHFRLIYEELYLDGEKAGDGDILIAEFWNKDRKILAIRYEDSKGNVDYLDEKGNSLRKEFIRTPVAFGRISSHFNLRRKHPVLNKIRAHKGIDYAAPTGTIIKAAGDGKVTFAGNKGGYGRTIIIQHGQKYTTLYAHLHRYAKGIRTGKRVRQGQTIGYVGSSGLATGPHLHYEFRVNGVHRNPLTVPLPKAGGIPEGERKNFVIIASQLRNQLTLQAEAAKLAANDEFQ